MNNKQKIGIVLNSSNKTKLVIVQSRYLHEKYKKVILTSTRYLVHDEKNEVNVGDTISAVECRPLSKTKSFRLNTIISAGVN